MPNCLHLLFKRFLNIHFIVINICWGICNIEIHRCILGEVDMKKVLKAALAVFLISGLLFSTTGCTPVDNEIVPGRVTPI